MDRTKKYALLIAVIMLYIVTIVALSKAEEKTDSMQGNKPETIKLPHPVLNSDTSIEEALLKRRSVRSFKDSSLSLEEISQLLWAAQGITSSRGLRTAPSAGALYPLELYVVAGSVNDLPDGIYNYRPDTHELARIVEGDKRTSLCNAALGQRSVCNAAAAIVFSVVCERTTAKYGDRGIQYAYIETGHAAQNVFLQAVSLDLGTVVIGAFYDDAVRKVLKMSVREQPLYIMPAGKKK